MVNPTLEVLQKIQTLARRDSRYKPEAYLFVLAALHVTVSQLAERRHDSEITSGAATEPGTTRSVVGEEVPAARQRGRPSSSRSHVTGQELLEGIRVYGLDQFGPLARQVFEHWGIQSTEDFGHIVFLLVEVKLLGKTEEDSIADFREVYDFAEAFDPQPLFKFSDDSFV